MIEHSVKKFVVRQKGFKDVPITFIGDGNKWYAFVGKHCAYIMPVKYGESEPEKSDAYGAWINLATAHRLSGERERPYVMEVKNG